MKVEKEMKYDAPEVEVEKGFAGSPNDGSGFDSGTIPGDGD